LWCSLCWKCERKRTCDWIHSLDILPPFFPTFSKGLIRKYSNGFCKEGDQHILPSFSQGLIPKILTSFSLKWSIDLTLNKLYYNWWSSENCMYKLQMKPIGGTSLMLLHIPSLVECPLMQWTYHPSLLPSHQASSPPICSNHLVKKKPINLQQKVWRNREKST
jgi:hypothetical protein